MTKLPAIHFEAKKHAWRQTQDGIVVSFVIHPQEINAEFAVAALGTRYMVAVAKIGDDEQPEPQAPSEASAEGEGRGRSSAPPVAKQAEYYGPPSDRTKRHWSELSLQEQMGIRCNEPPFWEFLRVKDKAAAEIELRRRLGVTSRAEVKRGSAAANGWAVLDTQYRQAIGLEPWERN